VGVLFCRRYQKILPKPPLQTPTNGTPTAGAPVAPPSGAEGLKAGNPEMGSALDIQVFTLEELKGMVDGGVNVLCVGQSKEWYRFEFTISRKEGDTLVGGHGRFRCRDMKVVTPSGEKVGAENLVLVRIQSVDLERKVVVSDPKEFHRAVESAIKETTEKLSKPPLQTPTCSTPAAGAPVAPEPGSAGR